MKKLVLFIYLFLALENASAQIEFIGNNSYGRIFDLTYHPTIQNRVYALSMFNHILVSNDNGSNWEIFFSMQNARIEKLEFYDNNTISFATSNRLASSIYLLDVNTVQIIYQYNVPIPPSDSLSIYRYNILPTNRNVLALVEYYNDELFSVRSTAYYTNDGGVSWKIINESYNVETGINNMILDVAIAPNNPQKIFISKFGNGSEGDIPGGGLYLSNDVGETWEPKILDNNFDNITFRPDNPDEVLIATQFAFFEGIEEGLYKSIDGGNTFSEISIDWYDFVSNTITDIRYDYNNPDRVIVLEENQVIITQDSFNTIQNTIYSTSPDDFNINDYFSGLKASFNPFVANEIYISGNYFPFLSQDSGASFTKKDNPFFDASLNTNLYKENNQAKHIYHGLQFGYLHKDVTTTTDDVYDLLPLNNLTANNATALFVDENREGRVYTVTGDNLNPVLNIKENHGDLNLISLPNFGANVVKSHKNNSNLLWVSFIGGDEQGNTFSRIFRVNINDPNNPQLDEVNLPATGICMAMLFDEFDDNVKIVSLSGLLYKTIDNGLTWSQLSNGLEQIDSNGGIIFDVSRNSLNQDQLLLSSSTGLFLSNDFGTTWEMILDENVNKAQFSPISIDTIIAFKYSSDFGSFELFSSINMGDSWQNISNDDLLNVISSQADLVFNEDSADIYIGTIDLGLMKYRLNFSGLNTPNFNEEEVLIYPMPSHDLINIESKAGNSITGVKLTDMVGKLVLQETNKNVIDVSTLQNGIYILSMKFSDGNILVKKIIKE